VSGSSQMKSRYASAPAMMLPPTSESRSTISNTASTDECRRRSASARSETRRARSCSAAARGRVRVTRASGP
jgi:hypothetical protein